MSIRRYDTGAGPRWQVEYYVGAKTKRRKSFDTERAAREFEAMRRLDRNKSTYDPRAGAKVTVAMAYERWLPTRPDASPHTIKCWKAAWNASVSSAFGSWSVQAVTPTDVQAWVNSHAGKVSPRTERAHHEVLNHVFVYAMAEGWVVANPCTGTRFRKLTSREPVFLTVDEVEELARLCAPYSAVVRTLAYTGLRIGELIELRVRDWDTERGVLHVRWGKTPSARRVVAVPELLRRDLDAWADNQSSTAPLFRSVRGKSLRREGFVKAVDWDKQRNAIGHPNLTPHHLRHTFASLSRRLTGSDLRKLQAQLGHAQASTTLQVYMHLFGDELADQAAALDRAIGDARANHKQK